jgi:hypothetical protein
VGRPGHVRVFDREMGERIANFSRIAYCPGVCTHTHTARNSQLDMQHVSGIEREREREREREGPKSRT